MLRFFVAGAPVPQERARASRGRFYTPARSGAWREQVVLAFRAAYPGHEPYARDVPLAVQLVFAMPGRGRRARIRGDADNLAKCVTDALNAVLWHDDAQIVELRVVKDRAGRGPVGVYVEVWPLNR